MMKLTGLTRNEIELERLMFLPDNWQTQEEMDYRGGLFLRHQVHGQGHRENRQHAKFCKKLAGKGYNELLLSVVLGSAGNVFSVPWSAPLHLVSGIEERLQLTAYSIDCSQHSRLNALIILD
jgi:hypothetical protein